MVTAPEPVVVVVGLLVGAAVLVLHPRPAQRLRRLVRGGTAEPDRVQLSRDRRTTLRRRRMADGGTDVAAVAVELASLTRGGLSPAAAWEAVGAGLGDDPAGRLLAAAAAAGRDGEPVRAVLLAQPPPRAGPGTGRAAVRWVRGRAELPAATAAQLAVLAATLGVHERTGAPVADLLERAASGLRADADAALARRSALAAPLATARVLVALPPLGLLLGVAVGGDPVRVLLLDPVGRWCAAVGALCAAGAWLWSRALVRRAVGP